MKIRWKIVQNRAWRRVGPSWGLLGCLIGVLERLGSILGASWERLGASWGRPGGIPEREGDPTWTPGWAQNRPKIDPKSHWFFDRFLDAILIPKWSQNGSPNLPKAVQKSVSFFDHFCIVFCIDTIEALVSWIWWGVRGLYSPPDSGGLWQNARQFLNLALCDGMLANFSI